MSKSSQLNQMSKKQILDSLLYQQQQGTATVNRLLIALAQAAKISPEEMAKFFVEASSGQEFADKLNKAIDDEIMKKQAELKSETQETGDLETSGGSDDEALN